MRSGSGETLKGIGVPLDLSVNPAAGPPLRSSRRFALLLGLVVLVGLAVRVDFLRNIAPPVPALGDAHAYHVLADNLAHGRGYIRAYDYERLGRTTRTAEYPPAFPGVLAGTSLVGLKTVEQQRIAMCFVGSITVLLIGLAGRRLGGQTVGVLAAFLAALYPMLFQADAALMPETIAALGGAATVLLALRAARSASVGRWLALGAVLGASMLARSEAVVLLALLVLPLAWRLRGVDTRRRLLLASCAVGLAVVAVLPWTVRNALTFHALVPVSNNVGSVARGANCELAYSGQYRGLWVTSVGDANGVSSVDPQNRCFSSFPIRPGVNEAQAAAELRSQGLHFAADHAGSVPGVMLARLGRSFGVYRFEQQTAFESLEGRTVTWERVGTREFQILAILAVGGTVMLLRRKRSVWPLVAMVVAVMVTTMLTYGNQRFRASAEPAVILLASVAIVAIGERLSTRADRLTSTQ
jgi:hypothetical protein